ncbi:MAG: HEAT repeat domain-containing protein [Chloroflexota bacterium]|nr:HEAT repeat domain-containing protein [Chloroflexota bacterium]
MRYLFTATLVLALAIVLLCLQPVALFAQGTSPDEVVDALLESLEQGDPLAQEEAGQALAELAPRWAIGRLAKIFETTDNPRPVAIALAGIGTPRAMAVLVNGLDDEELTAHRNAAQVALLNLGEKAVPSLVIGLRSRETPVRRNAAELLGFIGSPSAVNALLRVAKQDAEPIVREEAVWALGEIGEERIRLALQALAKTDPDPVVRIEAMRAALRLGEAF